VIFSALSEAAEAGELLLVAGGMCRFHQRKDGVVVIRELLVLPTCRRSGIGTGLIQSIRRMHPDATIRAVCPAWYPSNAFWRNRGFELVREEPQANTWELRGEVRR
jgi:N-acetylglutamate synthase-like GNAT family acetyltransferase